MYMCTQMHMPHTHVPHTHMSHTQFFLNDQLGYTGVILHPFHVDVHEYKTDEVGEANGVAFLRLPERDEFTKETTSDVESR
jgi:hypothetical protein